MKLKLELEYDGRHFHGWQSQDGLCTVQGVLRDSLLVFWRSLARKNKLEFSEESMPFLQGSGRTDAGVHALGQVVSFPWPAELSSLLSGVTASHVGVSLEGIARRAFLVKSAEFVHDTFDARFSPHRKCYQYSMRLSGVRGGLYQDRAWNVGSKLHLPDMISAARVIVGQHDFSAFRASDCQAQGTVRTVLSSELTRLDHDLLVYSICGKGFLKQMVRIIVGTLVEVGRGRLTIADIKNLLSAGKRADAGMTAPAHGLCLSWVRYD